MSQLTPGTKVVRTFGDTYGMLVNNPTYAAGTIATIVEEVEEDWDYLVELYDGSRTVWNIHLMEVVS